MFLYHGTTMYNAQRVIDYPLASAAMNGFGFYLTNDIEVARQYGSSVVCYEVDCEWSCNLVRPFNNFVENNEEFDGKLEYVLTQYEADVLVLDHVINCYITH